MPEDLVPTTRWEDETVGGAADEVKKEAMSAAESAKDVAGATARAAKEEAERQDGEGQFEDSAREIAGRATEEAKERAHEENLDSDGIKRRASEAGDRVRKRADE